MIQNYRSPALNSSGSITRSTSTLVKTSLIEKVINSNLTLTSLVDCFTVLVIYLLVASSMGGSEEMNISKDMQLPKAAFSSELKLGNVVRIENGHYYLNDSEITVDNMLEAMKTAIQKSDSIIVQADKNNGYAKVNPVVLSALQAGFKQVKFAVLQKDEG